MHRINPNPWYHNGYTLRLAAASDAEAYYSQNFVNPDPEVNRLTGTTQTFTKDQVITFFMNSLKADDRYLFLLIAPNGHIIGESVINEIDWEVKSANFRICIFSPEYFGQGLGSWATIKTRDFAFDQLDLHRLSLDVFSFNPRAQKAYTKAGFKVEGVLKDAIRDGDTYADDILMAILKDEWRALVR